jgi:methylated-DNA-[protein]-cysteine S-methyltransferase
MSGIAAPSPRRFDGIIPAPFGALGMRMSGQRLAEIVFLPSGHRQVPDSLRPVARALEAYFDDPARPFDVPITLVGTPFRQRVWAALKRIPVGQTTTYGHLARQLGSGARAVGQALGDNPIPLIIPCHRVLAASGLGGFMHTQEALQEPFPLTVKRWLLTHEGYCSS